MKPRRREKSEEESRYAETNANNMGELCKRLLLLGVEEEEEGSC